MVVYHSDTPRIDDTIGMELFILQDLVEAA